jgi:hypothetical protein
MFYLSGKNSDSSNNGRPPYFEYINCLPYLQGSSPLLQTWSTCNKSCVDNNWKPIRDVCVANAGSVDFNYSFIRVGTTGSDDQIMVNCAYGGESVFGYQTEFFESSWENMQNSYKTLSMDTVVAYSTGFIGVTPEIRRPPYENVTNNLWWYSSRETGALLIDSVEGVRITGIRGMTGGFGCSVSQKGDLVAVGAYQHGYTTNSFNYGGSFGKVYIYNTGGVLINEIYPPEGNASGGYPASADLGPSGGRAFGKSVALIGNEAVLIGAPWTSGFVTGTSNDGGDYLPHWTQKAGVSYIYSTGGQLLHTLSGSATGEDGLTSVSNRHRLFGWQGEANETSVAVANGGNSVIANNSDWELKQLAFYGTGGNYLNTIGPYFSTQGFEGSTNQEWLLNFWTLASNSQSFYTNRTILDYASLSYITDIKSFANDGSYLSSVRMPSESTPFAGGAIDASEKYLLIGDPAPAFSSEGPLGNVYIMETGDLFLKEISAPNSIPYFGHQVAANNDTYVGMNASGLLAYSLSGTIPFTGFTGQVGAAFDQWKGLLESVFTGATINFINLGLETGTTIGSNATQASYPLNSHIGNTRIGMEPGSKAAWSYCPGGTMNVVGELGGDIHMDRGAAWRKDETPTGDAPSGAYSIYYATAQAIGGALGFGVDTSSGSLMYNELKPEFTFAEKFPNGLSGSPYERNAAMGIYGV